MPLDPYFNLRPNRGKAPSRKADLFSTAAKVDAGVVQSLISALVTEIRGRPLSTIVSVVAGLLNEKLGITPNGDFQDAINSALYTLVGPDGRTVTAPPVERQPHQRSLTAGALGVSPSTAIHKATPRARRKFDEFSAALSDGRTLAAVLGDGNDGLPPGAMEVFSAAFTAIKNALIAGDAAAVHQAGADMAAMLVALDQVVNPGSLPAERAAPLPRMRRVGPNHYAADGHAELHRLHAPGRGQDHDERRKSEPRCTRRTASFGFNGDPVRPG